MDQTINAFDRAKLKPQKIHGQNKYEREHRVLVSTIHTASRREELRPDIIIVDEVHYGFSGQMLKRLIENNKNARIIGLSATPYDQNGKILKGFELFINDYDVRYLMKHNFLVQKLRQYELVKQDLNHVKIIAGDYDKRQLGEVVCNKNTILEIIETTKEFIENSKKTIVFAVDIVHAELLTQAYVNAGFKARALHSKINKDELDEPLEINDEIEKFRRGQTKVLVSVLMLTTGFDVPDADCAVIARPTKSQNLYKQMVGRILRKYKTEYEEKTEAILLDCGNVIKNLGMPLEPIKEIQNYEINNKFKCSECQSVYLKLSKIDNALYWICKDCGHKKEVDSGSYKCEECHEVHSYDSDFTTVNNRLYLNCECGHQTLISEYTGQEKLVEIKDKELEQSKQKVIQNLTKIKVCEIAKEAKVPNSKVLVKAMEMGIDLRSPQDEVFIEEAARILKYITEKWDCTLS